MIHNSRIIGSLISFWVELKAFASIHKDPLYHSLGRLVWGRFWFGYLLLALMIPSGRILLWMYPIPRMGGFFAEFLLYILTLIIQFSIPLSVVIAWGYLPFIRRNAFQVVSDLLVSPVEVKNIYRIMMAHSFFTLFIGYFLCSLPTWYISYSSFSKNGFDYPLGQIFFPTTCYNLAYHGKDPNLQYIFLLYPKTILQDLLFQFRNLVEFCFFPLIGILFLMAFWKLKGIASCLIKLAILYLSIHLILYFLHRVRVFLLPTSAIASDEMTYIVHCFLSLLLLSLEILAYFALFGYHFNRIQQYIPFSEEMQD